MSSPSGELVRRRVNASRNLVNTQPNESHLSVSVAEEGNRKTLTDNIQFSEVRPAVGVPTADCRLH